MRAVNWLAALPVAALLIGIFFVNRVDPFVLGMPFILFWIVLWLILTTVIMFIVYRFDSSNRGGGAP